MVFIVEDNFFMKMAHRVYRSSQVSELEGRDLLYSSIFYRFCAFGRQFLSFDLKLYKLPMLDKVDTLLHKIFNTKSFHLPIDNISRVLHYLILY